MGSVLKYQTLFFATFFLIGSFLANAQKEKKEDLRIYKFDKEGSVQVIKGYDVIEMKDRTIIYKEAKWKPVKIEGGILGLVEKGDKDSVTKSKKGNDYLECEKCNEGEVCVIKGASRICQKESDCNCKPNEVCVKGNCQSQHKRAKKTRSISVFN